MPPIPGFKPDKEDIALEKAIGRFITLFVRADTTIIFITAAYIGRTITETIFVLRGTDSRILAQRLKVLLRHRVKGSGDFQTALDHFCDAINLRNKLAHIPVVASGDGIGIWHVGSNIQKAAFPERTDLKSIKRYNDWLWIFINDLTHFWRASLKALPANVPSGDALVCRVLEEYPGGPKHARIRRRAKRAKRATKPSQSA